MYLIDIVSYRLIPIILPLNVPVIDEKPGKYMTVDGHQCLNLATHNYLGFAGKRKHRKSRDRVHQEVWGRVLRA